eukprot:2721230-Alexandrium_andersonii.AAC.1
MRAYVVPATGFLEALLPLRWKKNYGRSRASGRERLARVHVCLTTWLRAKELGARKLVPAFGLGDWAGHAPPKT